MDRYVPGTVFSSIDTQGRYAYANQPVIAQWNLTRFAETLLSIVAPDVDRATELLTEAIKTFSTTYQHHWLAGMRRKLGMATATAGDLDLINQLFAAMDGQNADYTLVFRRLSDAIRGQDDPVTSLFDDTSAIANWVEQWRGRLDQEDVAPNVRATAMDQVNPIYIPRNHKVEEALTAAVENNDLARFNKLLDIVKQPFIEKEGQEDYASPAPTSDMPYRTFCGT